MSNKPGVVFMYRPPLIRMTIICLLMIGLSFVLLSEAQEKDFSIRILSFLTLTHPYSEYFSLTVSFMLISTSMWLLFHVVRKNIAPMKIDLMEHAVVVPKNSISSSLVTHVNSEITSLEHVSILGASFLSIVSGGKKTILLESGFKNKTEFLIFWNSLNERLSSSQNKQKANLEEFLDKEEIVVEYDETSVEGLCSKLIYLAQKEIGLCRQKIVSRNGYVSGDILIRQPIDFGVYTERTYKAPNDRINGYCIVVKKGTYRLIQYSSDVREPPYTEKLFENIIQVARHCVLLQASVIVNDLLIKDEIEKNLQPKKSYEDLRQWTELMESHKDNVKAQLDSFLKSEVPLDLQRRIEAML